MSIDKGVAIGVGIVTILGAVVGLVTAFNRLDSRLDKLDDRVGKIEKTLGSAACNAILPRQIDAIEKNRKEAREQLEALSKQYDCGPQKAAMPSPFGDDWANAVMTDAINADDPHLSAALNTVDAQLNESNASGAPQSKGAGNSN